MNRRLALLDIICYVAIPFIIWNYGREPFGDYWAIIFSTVPGLIYTIYRFWSERQFNILGIFIILSLLIDTTVNLLSGSAENMLWNQVYLGYGYAGVFLISVVLKRPLALYFMVDWAYIQGFARKNSISLYYRRELFTGFQVLTGLFIIRSIIQTSFKAWLLQKYGPESYGQMLIYLRISGWIFSGVITIAFIMMILKINKVVEKRIEKMASVRD